MIIHIANNVVVIIIDFNPNPKSTIRIGTKAVKGALIKTLTQGSKSSSKNRFFPIKIPVGTPMTTAKNTPAQNE